MANPAIVQYGCECTKCGVHNGAKDNNAPVAYLVQRGEEFLKVCTRCDLSSDKILVILVDPESTDSSVFFEYDPLGALCLAMKLAPEIVEGGEEE